MYKTIDIWQKACFMGPLARYAKLPVRMRRECRERFPVTAVERSQHSSRHVRDARAVMHAGIAKERLPLKSAAGGKRSRHSRRMRNLQFDLSGKRPIVSEIILNIMDHTVELILGLWRIRLGVYCVILRFENPHLDLQILWNVLQKSKGWHSISIND